MTHQKGLKDDSLRLGRTLEVPAAAAAVVATSVNHGALRVELAVLLLRVVDVDHLRLGVLALRLAVALHVGDVVHRLLQLCTHTHTHTVSASFTLSAFPTLQCGVLFLALGRCVHAWDPAQCVCS